VEDLGRIKLFEYKIRLFQDGNQFYENNFKHHTIVIGREDDCDLVIQDKSISRKHLRLDVDIEKFYVTDMGSSNGTYVDNVKIEGRTRISSGSHIRAGKITIQVEIPEVKVEELKDIGQKYSKSNKEVEEITLSKIALHVEDRLETTRNHAEIMAVVDKHFVEEMAKYHPGSNKYISKKIESLVLWNKQIFDVDEFGYKDTITVGPDYDDSIHIPGLPMTWVLSEYEMNEAIFTVPKNLDVFAIRGSDYLSRQQLVAEKRMREDQHVVQIQISHYDVLRVEINENTQLYFRYVPSTVELESKKLLNPDVLIKKALITSFFIHLFLSLIFFLLPKEKLVPPKPKEEPPRIAKLIVEEKKIEPPVIPPVIPEPEPPKPEPEPEPIKEPEPEPPKPEPEPPKPPPVKEPEPPKPPPKKEPPPKPKKVEVQPPKKIEKPKPVQKQTEVVQRPVAPPVQAQPAQNPKGDNRPAGPQPVPTPVQPPTPPPPKPVDISKLGPLAALSGLKLDSRATKAPPAINIAQTSANTTTGAPTVGMNAITGDLKNQTATVAQNNANTGTIRTKGSASAKDSFNTKGLGSGTGTRGVKGAVVGAPKLAAANSGRTEGLSRDQVLKAIQPYLGKIQSCYERSMLSDPNLAGVIDFEWVISASGKVSSVGIKKNSVAGGEQLGECVSGVIQSIKFPNASNGEQTYPNISFPFGRM
jgi:pSer/pThr/pTyr-binding forkhead associated (FHA) protein